MILRVRKEICAGCGLCAESCPQEAVSIQFGKARIDQTRCNRCGICFDVCPQEAIVEWVPVSEDKLEATVSSLKHRANELIAGIERLRKSR